MNSSKRSPTTKAISLIWQLFKQDQITLAPEFQRNNVWPRTAKAYLIDTILNDKPIPIFFLQRTTSPQTGKFSYAVIDGQQRLRAIFEFLDNRFTLSASKKQPYYKKRFSKLPEPLKQRIYNYDLIVEELSNYDHDDIVDMFVRMNKYVVKLSPQELRHARSQGAFKDFVEDLANWDFWEEHKVFSPKQLQRMKATEFVAELTILLIEGPQDKKASIDLYYGQYRDSFPAGASVKKKLKTYLDWIPTAIPTLRETRFRKPVDLYSLVGALNLSSDEGGNSAGSSRRGSEKPSSNLSASLALRTRPVIQHGMLPLRAVRRTT